MSTQKPGYDDLTPEQLEAMRGVDTQVEFTWKWFLIGLGVYSPVLYTFLFGAWYDGIPYTLQRSVYHIAVPGIIGGVVLCLAERVDLGAHGRRLALGNIVFNVVCGLAVVALAWSYFVAFTDFIAWLYAPDRPRPLVAIVMMPLAFCIGKVLFKLRSDARYTYGLMEVMVGLTASAAKIYEVNTPTSDLTLQLWILTSGVYLIVRGLDSMEQAGRDSDPLYKVYRYFTRRVLRAANLRRPLG